MRYTRQLVTAALIAAAGLGMGACSAQPGAAVTSSNGSYSIAEVNEAVAQIAEFTGGQTNIDAVAVRAHLMNEPLLEHTGAAVGVAVSDEQIDQAVASVAQQVGVQSPELGRGTRAAVKSMLLRQELNRFVSANPQATETLNMNLAQAREASDTRINPRFVQPSVGGTEEKSVPMFGDAVSGEKEPDLSSLLGGGAPGTTTR